MLRIFSISGAAALCLLLCSCDGPFRQKHRWEPESYRPQQRQNRDLALIPEKELLPKVESVAVLPFVDQTFGKDNTLDEEDLIHVANEFANHLTASQTFRKVLYPQPCLEALIGSTYSIKRQDDLKEIANLLDVDAIVFGVINQYKMYYPPELSMSMRFYLTRAERFATSSEVSAMSHSGVPLYDYNPTFFRQLWDQSAFYDGAGAELNEKMKKYLKVQRTAMYGFREDRVLRTKYDFLKFISYDLADSLGASKGDGKKRRSTEAERRTTGLKRQ